MSPARVHPSQFWSTDRSLTVFLILLILLVFVAQPLGDLALVGRFGIGLLFSFLLVSGVAAVAQSRAMLTLTTGVVLLALLAIWMEHVAPRPALSVLHAASVLVCLGLLAWVVLRRVFQAGPITMDRVQGSVAVYLLLGLMWTFAYTLVALHDPDAFQPAIPATTGALQPKLVYFSFVTLTTTGYGDFTPVNPIARALSNLESLVGQLYPVVLIARLVAMELQFRDKS
ncbi:MAG: ion channel [Nitrospiraceae bacterium]